MSFLTFIFPILSCIPPGVGEWASSYLLLSCSLGLNHDKLLNFRSTRRDKQKKIFCDTKKYLGSTHFCLPQTLW